MPPTPSIPSAAPSVWPPHRVLLVDDEPPARQRLRTHLAAHPDFIVVDECGTAPEAIARIRLLQPDLVFLDVDIPGASGLSVWREHGVNPPPQLVLVTAYREFALEGFEAHAADYLLKPFEAERFARALACVRRALRGHGSPGSAGEPSRLVLKHDGAYHLIPSAELLRAESDGDFIRVHTVAGTHFVRQTLGGLQSQLDVNKFLRVHRSHLVSRAHIAKITTRPDGDYSLTMTDGTTVPVARALTDAVRPLFHR